MRIKQTPLSVPQDNQPSETGATVPTSVCDHSTLEVALQRLVQSPPLPPPTTGTELQPSPSVETVPPPPASSTPTAMDTVDGRCCTPSLESCPALPPLRHGGAEALDLSTKTCYSFGGGSTLYGELKLEDGEEDMDSDDSHQLPSRKTTPTGGVGCASPSPLRHPRHDLPHHHHHLGELGLSGFGPLSEHTLVCIECRKTFRFEKNFLRHMQKAHATGEGESVLKCKLCNYTTKHYSNMYVHIRTHTGDKPYFCAGCGANFTQGSSLKLHIKSRHGDKPGYFCLTKKPGKNNLTKLWTRVLKKDLGRLSSLPPGSGHHLAAFSAMGHHLGLDSGPFGMFGHPPPQFYPHHGMLPPFGHPAYNTAVGGGGPPFRPPPGFGPENFGPHHTHHPPPSFRHPSVGESAAAAAAVQQRFGSFIGVPQPVTIRSAIPQEIMKLEAGGGPEDVSTDTSMIDLHLRDLQDKSQTSPTLKTSETSAKEASQLSHEFSTIQLRLRSVLQQLQAHNPHLLQDSDPALRNQLLSLLGLPTPDAMAKNGNSASPPTVVPPPSREPVSPSFNLPRLQPSTSVPGFHQVPVRSEPALPFSLQSHLQQLPQPTFQPGPSPFHQPPGMMMPFHPLHPVLRS